MLANLVLTNGRIFTLNPAEPTATALAIRDQFIVGVGDDEQMKALLAPSGRVVNLEGATVIPGLVDAHCHFQWYALGLLNVDVYEVSSLAMAQERVAQFASQRPAGSWLVGRGWKNQLWDNPALPTAADLDVVAPHHPVLLRDKSGHTAWVNSLALKIAGISAHTPNPAGGEIARDEKGQPTGILYENAIDLVRHHIPDFTHEQTVQAMQKAQENCWAVGLTGVHDFDGRESFLALQELNRAGQLGLRVYKNLPISLLDHVIAIGLQTDFGDEWLRMGGMKIFADGALGGKTALMVEPYENEPTNLGIAVTDKEEMLQAAVKASANGLSVTVHAIGDRAVHDILDVYEVVRREEKAHGRPHLRHRIEHVQVYHPADKNRLGQLGVVASMQPVHCASDMVMADAYWGERAQYSYAWRDMLNSGALLVFGSDFPIEKIDPLHGLYAAVSRQQLNGGYAPAGGWYGAQKLTMTEAVTAFTQAAALTSGQSHKVGTIQPGKWADLTIFDRNIFALDPAELLETKVIGTLTAGVFRYRQF